MESMKLKGLILLAGCVSLKVLIDCILDPEYQLSISGYSETASRYDRMERGAGPLLWRSSIQ
jgi:hypothetical protein